MIKSKLCLSAVAAILVFLWLGCSRSPNDPSNSSSISISTSLKELGISSAISKIVLEVSGDGFPAITQELTLVNGLVRTELEVPFGNERIFDMTAFNASDVELYHGADTVDVSAGSVTEVSIYMQPAVPMIKVTPLYKDKIGGDVRGSFDIYVFNVDSLFGLSLRVEFDSSIIRIDSVKSGEILGGPGQTLFFYQLLPTSIPMAYTLRGNQQPQGSVGSGTVAHIWYTTGQIGKTSIEIPTTTLRVIDWQGNSLPRIGRLYIENGEVEVIAL